MKLNYKTTLSALAVTAVLAGTAIAGSYDMAHKQLDQSKLNTIDGLTGPNYYKGVSVEEGAMIKLDQEVGLKDHYLRSRFVIVEPDGVVLLHKHQNRPAFTYIATGEIVEFRNDDVPTGVRKAGEITVDADGLAQWWKNDGDETVRLYVVDVVHADEVKPGGKD